MRTSQDLGRGRAGRDGSLPVKLADLRRRLEAPSKLEDEDRERLLELTKRVSRVQAFGGAYNRVSLSSHVSTAMDESAVVV